MESKNCIVCFLDILGYRDLIASYPVEKIHSVFEKFFDEQAVFKAYSVSGELFYKHLKIQLLSDSLIFAFNIDSFIGKGSSRVVSGVDMFLDHLAICLIDLTMKLKYFVRGGMAFGEYYQSDAYSPENQFIASKALIEAYELSKFANVPRILINDSCSKYFFDLLGKDRLIKQRIARDKDGFYFLDVYASLEYRRILKSGLVFKKIAQSLNFQLDKCKKKSKEMRRYHWFIEQHNKAIDKKIQNIKTSSVAGEERIEDYEMCKVDFPEYLLLTKEG